MWVVGHGVKSAVGTSIYRTRETMERVNWAKQKQKQMQMQMLEIIPGFLLEGEYLSLASALAVDPDMIFDELFSLLQIQCMVAPKKKLECMNMKLS